MLPNIFSGRGPRAGSVTQTPFPYRQLFILGRSNEAFRYLEPLDMSRTAKFTAMGREARYEFYPIPAFFVSMSCVL